MNPASVQSARDDMMEVRMARLGVREADLEECFVRSGGHGGQNVNKVSTCVMLIHRPSGLRVKCQVSRQQGLNRELARRMLLDKIEAARRDRLLAQRQQVEQARRRNRPRSRAAKNRILDNKIRHSAKKAMRRVASSD
jgi:peptide chain release factor